MVVAAINVNLDHILLYGTAQNCSLVEFMQSDIQAPL